MAAPISQDWFRFYFEEPYGSIYQEYLLPESVTREEAQFCLDVLELQPGDKLLDGPCGYGRHLELFSSLFAGVVGLDLSPDCLRRAREQLPAVSLIRGDLRGLPFRSRTFDAALNLFNSFGYFSNADNQVLLEEYARVLKPGGQFILDVANRTPLLEIIAETPQTRQEKEDLTVVEDWHFNAGEGRMENHTLVELGGRRLERNYSLRIYGQEELEMLVERAGFCVEDWFGDFDEEPYDPVDSCRMILWARKV